jgi:hypothetical protein
MGPDEIGIRVLRFLVLGEGEREGERGITFGCLDGFGGGVGLD